MVITGLKVLGDSGKTYVIEMMQDGSVKCSCPAWKYSSAPVLVRLCKHMNFVRHQLPAVVNA